MSQLIKVAETTDLQPGECKTVVAGGRELALFNVGGKFFATDNVCPHQGGPLGDGILEDCVVVCPWHGWRFDVRTGQSPVVPSAKVEAFPCVVEGADIKVTVD